MKAKFIGTTFVAGVEKDRWECPNCKANKEPESRFNLSAKKRNREHTCRFCKQKMLMVK